MGIDFYKLKKAEDIELAVDGVSFEEELQTFLCKDWHCLELDTGIILDIDPYGEEIFDSERIKQIISACDLLYQAYDELNIKDFALKLKKLCEEALSENKIIFALGD
jgi:hypothetical protein